jgi:hypothetical protein
MSASSISAVTPSLRRHRARLPRRGAALGRSSEGATKEQSLAYAHRFLRACCASLRHVGFAFAMSFAANPFWLWNLHFGTR